MREKRPRKDRRGFDLISDALPFGRLWYAGPNAMSNAVSYAQFFSRSHNAVIRVYDQAGNVIEAHEYAGDLKEPVNFCSHRIARPAKRIANDSRFVALGL